MKKIVLVSYDRVANCFIDNGLLPMAHNDEEAKRRLGASVCNLPKESLVSLYDYQLYKIGEYDVENGIISAYEKPIFIVNYSEVISAYGRKQECSNQEVSE